MMTVTTDDGEKNSYLGVCNARGTPEKRAELVCWICFYLAESKTVTKSSSSGSGSGYSDSDYDDGSDYEWQ